ncbi:hypothetical protein EVAR_31935_1 [Eumeta japonica]|uniref:Uncharacterized protein n=1 Tax=Eumeta variegata TaxID=151549 RepID=A0A4C1WST1_EUMVA|nr:hypothetical protein EVAR_31935_1 [Eumeta japonica]
MAPILRRRPHPAGVSTSLTSPSEWTVNNSLNEFYRLPKSPVGFALRSAHARLSEDVPNCPYTMSCSISGLTGIEFKCCRTNLIDDLREGHLPMATTEDNIMLEIGKKGRGHALYIFDVWAPNALGTPIDDHNVTTAVVLGLILVFPAMEKICMQLICASQ